MKKMHLSLINNLKYMISTIVDAYGILDVFLFWLICKLKNDEFY